MKNDYLKIDLDTVIKIAVKAGIDAAIKKINSEREIHLKQRYDKRLRNTRLLLKNLNNFKIHKDESIYKWNYKNTIEVFDELERIEIDNIYVESISKSIAKTNIILCHIEKMLEVYKYLCDRTGEEENIRKYKVIDNLYLLEEPLKIQDISDLLNIHITTVYRTKDEAIKEISCLLFGIDGLNLI